MRMSVVLTATSSAYLLTPTLPRLASVSRPIVPRTASPLAFEGGLEDLSTNELQGLLRFRGVVGHEALETKAAMVEALRASTAPVVGAGLPAFASESEKQRIDTFERVSPAVAFIQTSVSIDVPLAGVREYPAGAGSGFVWDTNGHIITNYHVIAGQPGMSRARGRGRQMPRRVMVSLQGCAEPLEAVVVGTEPDKDLAVLKVDPATCPVPLQPLEVASSAELRVGQSVLAIGNPFGLDYTLTSGIVSALGRDIDGAGGRPIRDCIQMDAAINPGNSGGPLLDSSGRLIGVNTMIYSPNGAGGNVGIGFAIPVDTVSRVVRQLLTYGNNARPSLGVSLLDDQLRAQYARSLGRQLEGAVVMEVVAGSPADALRLQPSERRYGGVVLGDMIVAVDGKPVRRNEDLVCALEESERDQPITLSVMRGCEPGRLEELTLTPVARSSLMEAR